MTLNSTLKAKSNQNDKMVTFYHVSTEVNAFKSFFREGAKAIGQGIGGQKNGFFVWTTDTAADRHIRFLHEDPFADKVLENNEAIIVGVSVPKSSLSYPIWQTDYEKSTGLFRLWTKYGDFINKKGHDLMIPFDEEDKPLGWNFLAFTGFTYEKKHSHLDQKEWHHITFKGIDDRGREKIKTLMRSQDALDEHADGAYDSVKFQILTDWLCQNNPDFKNDYDHLIQKMASHPNGFALKYTGREPLPVTYAQYVKMDKKGNLEKQVLFDASKDKNQVCPFLTMGIARTRKER